MTSANSIFQRHGATLAEWGSMSVNNGKLCLGLLEIILDMKRNRAEN